MSGIFASHPNNKYKIFIDEKKSGHIYLVFGMRKNCKEQEEVPAVEKFKFDLAIQKTMSVAINPENS